MHSDYGVVDHIAAVVAVAAGGFVAGQAVAVVGAADPVADHSAGAVAGFVVAAGCPDVEAVAAVDLAGVADCLVAGYSAVVEVAVAADGLVAAADCLAVEAAVAVGLNHCFDFAFEHLFYRYRRYR